MRVKKNVKYRKSVEQTAIINIHLVGKVHLNKLNQSRSKICSMFPTINCQPLTTNDKINALWKNFYQLPGYWLHWKAC